MFKLFSGRRVLDVWRLSNSKSCGSPAMGRKHKKREYRDWEDEGQGDQTCPPMLKGEYGSDEVSDLSDVDDLSSKKALRSP